MEDERINGKCVVDPDFDGVSSRGNCVHIQSKKEGAGLHRLPARWSLHAGTLPGKREGWGENRLNKKIFTF